MDTKRIVVAVAAIAGLASCGENSTAYKNLQARFDSLALVTQNYEAEMSETDSLVASVLTNFQDISTVGAMINTNPYNGDVRKSDKERIKDNVQLITDKLRASQVALDELTQKLEGAGKENKRLRATISALRKELELQKVRVLQMTEELQRKDVAIGVLDSMVTSLSGDVGRLSETTTRQGELLASQDKDLHRVRYCIGTSSDLKDMNLLKGGRVITEGANNTYFTEADQRELTQIPLMSKKAKLLTVHSASSYQLVPDGDKVLTLHIKDPKAFWSNSRMLIIQVD